MSLGGGDRRPLRTMRRATVALPPEADALASAIEHAGTPARTSQPAMPRRACGLGILALTLPCPARRPPSPARPWQARMAW